MENQTYSDELQHHGTKGMRWGIRRYQNKDGSLTPAGQKRYNKEMESLKKEKAKLKAEQKVLKTKKANQSKLDKLEAEKQKLAEQKKALKEENRLFKKKKGEPEEPNETPDQIRERLLKSTDAAEIYKHKDLLSYQELNDRVNRIDLENRLQGKIVTEQTKSGREYMDKARSNIESATNLFRSVDNAYSSVGNSAIGKTIAKQLGIEPPKKEFNIAEAWKNRNKMSTQELMDFNKRLTAEDQIKKKMDEREEAENSKKSYDDFQDRLRKGEIDNEGRPINKDNREPYRKKGEDLTDNVTYTRERQLPAVVNKETYSTGLDYYNSSKASTTRINDVEIIEPEWVKKMRRNGLLEDKSK